MVSVARILESNPHTKQVSNLATLTKTLVKPLNDAQITSCCVLIHAANSHQSRNPFIVGALKESIPAGRDWSNSKTCGGTSWGRL